MVADVPQLKVITPPRLSAAASADCVHEDGVPVPTTVVGLLVSTGPIGAVHTLGGKGAAAVVTLNAAAGPVPQVFCARSVYL
jgi:hypothetical protein